VQPAGRPPGTVVVPETLVAAVRVDDLLDIVARQLLGHLSGNLQE
jgi:hypothetical protein